MKLINADGLIEKKGFFVEDERGCIMCVVAAQDIRNAPSVDLVPVVPGHDDQHNLTEMAYNNGYVKGYEDGSNRKHGQWIRRNHGQVSWVECSECFICGSPEWVSCPVCDTKMDEKNDNSLLFADMEEIIDATD